MTPTLSESNSFVPTKKDVSATDVTAASETNAWATIAKRFWDYTEATSEGDTKSFEGLL